MKGHPKLLEEYNHTKYTKTTVTRKSNKNRSLGFLNTLV